MGGALLLVPVIPAQAGIQTWSKALDPRFRGGDENGGGGDGRARLRERRRWAALRDALLPKLVSGELRIRDVERIVGRCA